MTATVLKKREAIKKAFLKYKEKMPEIGKGYDAFSEEAYRAGSIDPKHKRLMALTGALVSGCEPCILFQTEKTLESGATVEEILETCAVAISLGGTMAAGQTTKVVCFLEEKSLID